MGAGGHFIVLLLNREVNISPELSFYQVINIVEWNSRTGYRN